MKKLVLLFLWIGHLSPLLAQSPTVQSLKETEIIRTGYYLYPSTLRMLNFTDDPEINRLVKGIRKLSLLNMKPKQFDQEQMTSTLTQLQEQEDMEVYLDIHNDSLEIIALGNQEAEELIILGKVADDFYLAELEGNINLGVLPKIIEKVNNRDTTETNGFSMIFDALSKDINREKRREQRRDARRKAREGPPPAENPPGDSTQIDSSQLVLPKDTTSNASAQ